MQTARDPEEYRLGQGLRWLRTHHPDVLARYGIPNARLYRRIPVVARPQRAPWLNLTIKQAQTLAITASRTWSPRHGGKRPRSGSGACVELCGFTWGGLNTYLRQCGTSLAQSMPSIREQQCLAIIAFKDKLGHWPRMSAVDPYEKRLGMYLSNMRGRCPEELAKFHIPIKGDRRRVA